MFLSVVLEALVQLFNEPEASHPLRDEIANEYLKEKEKFEEVSHNQLRASYVSAFIALFFELECCKACC